VSPRRARTEVEKRRTFTPEEIRRLLEQADVQMRAMIWLGLNCAFGNTDVAELRWDDLDLEKDRTPRPCGRQPQDPADDAPESGLTRRRLISVVIFGRRALQDDLLGASPSSGRSWRNGVSV